MDEFVLQLDVTQDANLDELPDRFAHVLSLMHIDPYAELDVYQVKVLLKFALFLYGNLSIHGYSLEQKLKECQRIPKNDLNSFLSKFHAGTFLSHVCEQLLMTITGPNHILEIQNFCSTFLDTDQYSGILSRAREARRSLVVENRVAREANFLINATFQLQSGEEIELAIQRIVDHVEFDVLAWIIINFEEPLTYFAMKCIIVQKELCSRLASGLVSGNFITSMYEVSAIDGDGLSMFFKCLQNRLFAKSLMTFFTNYLTAIEALNRTAAEAKLLNHDFQHVSFLIAGMLSKKSDCRIEFHKILAAVSLNVNVLLRISHLNFVYEF